MDVISRLRYLGSFSAYWVPASPRGPGRVLRGLSLRRWAGAGAKVPGAGHKGPDLKAASWHPAHQLCDLPPPPATPIPWALRAPVSCLYNQVETDIPLPHRRVGRGSMAQRETGPVPLRPRPPSRLLDAAILPACTALRGHWEGRTGPGAGRGQQLWHTNTRTVSAPLQRGLLPTADLHVSGAKGTEWGDRGPKVLGWVAVGLEQLVTFQEGGKETHQAAGVCTQSPCRWPICSALFSFLFFLEKMSVPSLDRAERLHSSWQGAQTMPI